MNNKKNRLAGGWPHCVTPTTIPSVFPVPSSITKSEPTPEAWAPAIFCLTNQGTVNGTRNFFAFREALAGCRGAVLTRFVEPHRVAKGCPLWHKRRSETPRFVYAAYRACVLGEQKNAVHTAHTMTHIITHNSKHTAHTITHTLTHKKDHNPIDTPQNNPHKRRVNHFAVFVPQPFRAIDKLAVRESHEVRTYTNSP